MRARVLPSRLFGYGSTGDILRRESVSSGVGCAKKGMTRRKKSWLRNWKRNVSLSRTEYSAGCEATDRHTRHSSSSNVHVLYIFGSICPDALYTQP